MPCDLVGGHRHADAGAADQDAGVDLAVHHLAAHLLGEVGVVDRGVGLGAEVLVLDLELVEQFADVALEGDAGVIGAEGHAHPGILL